MGVSICSQIWLYRVSIQKVLYSLNFNHHLGHQINHDRYI